MNTTPLTPVPPTEKDAARVKEELELLRRVYTSANLFLKTGDKLAHGTLITNMKKYNDWKSHYSD